METRLEASQSRSRASAEFEDAHQFDVNVQLQQSGLAWENEQRDARQVDQISQELGELSLGHADMMAQYYGKCPQASGARSATNTMSVGNAAGARFAKIFFSSLNLDPRLSMWTSTAQLSPQHHLLELDQSCASLPPKHVADFAMAVYNKRVHVWWPVVTYPALRSIYSGVYKDGSTCGRFQRFVVFITLAIGAKEAQDTGFGAKLESVFAPEEYYRTALQFFGSFSGLDRIIALILLIIWSMRSPLASDHLNLWQMVRQAMSLAIEMGLHRNGVAWEFSPSELEAKNRCWWCMYGLER